MTFGNNMNTDTSLVLSIYNQEPGIAIVLTEFLLNMSDNVKELIFVIDGCTDKTDEIVKEVLKGININTKFFYADNVFEVKANNIGFKAASCPWIITIQDDMIMTEKDFDKRLMKPFLVKDTILGVTSRNAQNERIVGEFLHCYDVAGKDVNTPRNVFAIRDIIVRGPVLFNHERLQKCDYLNEEFAPINCDDKDLCYRAYRLGYEVGAYVTEFEHPRQWSKTVNDENSIRTLDWSFRKNMKMIIERHADLINGKRHNQDIIVE